MKLKIKKDDVVKVITGADKGKTGRVLDVYPAKMKVLVEQINVRSKHARPSAQNPQGGIVKLEMPIHYSNVMILDSDKKATKIGLKRVKSGEKMVSTRYAKTNKKDLSN